jgi:hypothetical protein
MTPPWPSHRPSSGSLSLNDQVRDTLTDFDRLLAMPADQRPRTIPVEVEHIYLRVAHGKAVRELAARLAAWRAGT